MRLVRIEPARRAGKSTIARLALAAFVALALAACTSTPEPEPEPEPPAETGSEFDQGQVAEPEPEPVAVSRDVPLQLETVYFDFDKSVIREDGRATLRANAEQILESDKTVTIEGHCDERGSEEYNLALGERRANAIRSYLVNLGVPSSQLRTISYGEAKPAVQGHDESAWRWNRRGAFRSGS